MWGRLCRAATLASIRRNTPTGVGKTVGQEVDTLLSEKHPHGCGEDLAGMASCSRMLETPPRVWGRRHGGATARLGRRNTPTGVGKTPQKDRYRDHHRKHPHGCGEDAISMPMSTVSGETPPRVWGRQTLLSWFFLSIRNTPTGVGKTSCSAPHAFAA